MVLLKKKMITIMLSQVHVVSFHYLILTVDPNHQKQIDGIYKQRSKPAILLMHA